MLRNFILAAFFLPLTVFAQIPENYYSDAMGKSGVELKEVLNEIIKDHTEFSYRASYSILEILDQDPCNPNHVIGIYSGYSMNARRQYDSGRGWNREHVWAKSKGDFGTTKGAGTDLHHLRAADVSTNSARNNRLFQLCDTPYEDTKGNYTGISESRTCSSNWAWEPRDEVKGDVARILFYMATRYEGVGDEPDLELINRLLEKGSKDPYHGLLSVLLQWHILDPVSSEEIRRNDLIYYEYQKNRNPFIDHPEFVALIWN